MYYMIGIVYSFNKPTANQKYTNSINSNSRI